MDAFVSLNLNVIDILFMQEVMNPFTLGFQGYTIHYKTDTSRQGTAILTRDTIVVTNLFRIPTGRAIAASLGHYSSSTYMLPPEPPNDQNGRPSSTTTSTSSWGPPLSKNCWEMISIAYWRLLTPLGMTTAADPLQHWYRITLYATHGRRLLIVTLTNITPHM
jgi:hypothetical protein